MVSRLQGLECYAARILQRVWPFAGEDRLNFVMAKWDQKERKLKVNKQALSLMVPVLFFLVLPAHATDVRVLDSKGVEVLVRDITIDYSGILGSDKDTEGVRVSQGEAQVTAKWSDIVTLTITGRDPDVGRMTVEIGLKDGKKVNATLLRKGRMKLLGKSDLGEYSIDLEKIQKLTVVSDK